MSRVLPWLLVASIVAWAAWEVWPCAAILGRLYLCHVIHATEAQDWPELFRLTWAPGLVLAVAVVAIGGWTLKHTWGKL